MPQVDIKINPKRKTCTIPGSGKKGLPPKEMPFAGFVITTSWQTLNIPDKFLKSEHGNHWFNVEKPGSQSNESRHSKIRKARSKKTSTKKKKVSKKKVSKKKTETRKAA